MPRFNTDRIVDRITQIVSEYLPPHMDVPSWFIEELELNVAGLEDDVIFFIDNEEQHANQLYL